MIIYLNYRYFGKLPGFGFRTNFKLDICIDDKSYLLNYFFIVLFFDLRSFISFVLLDVQDFSLNPINFTELMILLK